MSDLPSDVGFFGPGDGCTLWLDGWFGTSWRHCCDVHDIAYAQLADRAQADWDLAVCVANSGALLAPVMALVMWIGVWAFGRFLHHGSKRGTHKSIN